MATVTYEPIATITLSSAQQTVDFTSIPTTYTDLVLVSNIIGTTNDYLRVRLGNGSVDTGSNYSTTVLAGSAGTGGAATYRYANNSVAYVHVEGYTSSSRPTINILNIFDYKNTSKYKTFINRCSETGAVTETSVNLWRSTAAINIIRIFQDTYNIGVGSTFTLYGIKAE